MPKKKPTTSHYPLRVQITLLATNGEQYAELSGMEYTGHFPTHEEILKSIQDAASRLPIEFRLVNPEELLEWKANDMGLGGIHIAGDKEYLHQADIDRAWARGRAMLAKL